MEIQTYVTVLMDTLEKKQNILNKLYDATKCQEEVLDNQEVDVEAFEELMNRKELLLDKLQELDRGFDGIYQQISVSLQAQKEMFKAQILKMQELIRELTSLGIKIQALEQRNRDKFERYLTGERQEIRKFQTNHRTANLYHQHMANQHQQWQSYFLDKKK